jgi:hypothetical protein
MAVTAFFDSSGKPHDKEARLTLAAFAASDIVWADLERQWNEVLHKHPLKPRYIHMKELCPLRDEFSVDRGWTREEAFGLVNQMLLFLQHYKKESLQMYYCTIDLEARRRLVKDEGFKIPLPVDLCNEFCSETVLKAHFKKAWDKDPDTQTAEEMAFVFDAGEKFYGPFRKKWEAEVKKFRRDGGFNPWNVITSVTTTTNMKKLPGLQAADILAWAVNREHTVQEGSPGKYHAHFLRQVVSQYYIDFDEMKLRQKYGRIILN